MTSLNEIEPFQITLELELFTNKTARIRVRAYGKPFGKLGSSSLELLGLLTKLTKALVYFSSIISIYLLLEVKLLSEISPELLLMTLGYLFESLRERETEERAKIQVTKNPWKIEM